MFIGFALSLLWIPRLSDRYSRKSIFMIGAVFNLGVLFATIWAQKIETMLVLNFLVGVALPTRYNVGFVYLMELLPRSK